MFLTCFEGCLWQFTRHIPFIVTTCCPFVMIICPRVRNPDDKDAPKQASGEHLCQATR